jgi:Protein of unknown function (DUF1579)
MTHRHPFVRLASTALFAALALMMIALPAVAQDAKAKADAMMAQGEEMKGKAEDMKAQAGEMMEHGEHQMSAEEAAMMKAWQEAMTPGAPQEHLAKAAGDFTYAVKFWMGDPSAEPQVSTGTAHREMIMGGRYLVEKVKGEMMGQEFHGMGTTGYDNTKGTYWNTWFDNMSTGVMVSEGKTDDSGKMVMTGDYVDPMTREAKTSKTVLWWDGADKETMQMFEKRGDDWVKTMEIEYTRTK